MKLFHKLNGKWSEVSGSSNGSSFELPENGINGQVLVKDDTDVTGLSWKDLSESEIQLPENGANGQALVKDSSNVTGLNWKDLPSETYVDEAPQDGVMYLRKNGSWVSSTNALVYPQHNVNDNTIGVSLVANSTPIWMHTNSNGEFVTLGKTWFDNHPIWGNITQEVIDGQYLMRIPKFYMKNDNHTSLWISDKKVDDSFKCHPAFMYQGEELDCFYIGKYEGSQDASDATKIASVPGVATRVNINWTNSKLYCENRNNTEGVSGFCMTNFYMISALQKLFMIEYASGDAQTSIGSGHSSGSAVSTTDNATVATANYRGIIGLWGNAWEWIDGIDNENYMVRIWDNKGYQTWITTQQKLFAYANSLGSGYGFITKMSTETGQSGDGTYTYDMKDVFMPTAISSTTTNSPYPDYIYGSGGTTKCLFGGRYGVGVGCGFFTLHFSDAASYSNASIGVRLARYGA